MMYLAISSCILFAVHSAAYGIHERALAKDTLAEQFNCSLKLAVKPSCTTFSSSTFGNANMGIDLRKIKNVVPFGDSWT